EEDLAVGRDPHGRIQQRAPVRREQRVEAVDRAGQEQGAHHEDDEHDQQQRDEDDRAGGDALLHAERHDDDDREPHHDHGDQHGRDDVEGDRHVGAAERLGVLAEEPVRVIAPALVEREDRVVRGPGQDQRVVQRDDQGDEHLPPADELGPAPEAAPGGGGGAAPAVPDRVVEEEQRDAGGQQRDQVRQDERAAAVLVGDGREAPDVAEADGGADGREDERGAAGE